MASASPTLAALAKSYEITRKRARVPSPTYPPRPPIRGVLRMQLKSQQYRFVGRRVRTRFMQNVGTVNDHLHGCFRASDYHPSMIR